MTDLQGINVTPLDRVYEARRKWLARTVTLNYKPAILSGVKEDRATVRTLDGQEQAEFSWMTVVNIIKNHEGSFVS